MGGVPVVDGSTLSTTGLMQVTCNVPYVLSVDGVVWTPTASEGGVDTYLLSTSGVVRIYIDGKRYFIFSNSVVADFSFNRFNYYFYDSGNNTLFSGTSTGKYLQKEWVANTAKFTAYLSTNVIHPEFTVDEIIALGGTCISGDVTLTRHSSGNTVRVDLTGFDTSVYNALFVGNVLIAFLEPLS